MDAAERTAWDIIRSDWDDTEFADEAWERLVPRIAAALRAARAEGDELWAAAEDAVGAWADCEEETPIDDAMRSLAQVVQNRQRRALATESAATHGTSAALQVDNDS